MKVNGLLGFFGAAICCCDVGTEVLLDIGSGAAEDEVASNASGMFTGSVGNLSAAALDNEASNSIRDITGLTVESNSSSIAVLVTALFVSFGFITCELCSVLTFLVDSAPFLTDDPSSSAAAGDAAATAATVVIAAADAVVAVTLVFAPWLVFCAPVEGKKQHELVTVPGVGGVGGETIAAWLLSKIYSIS